MKRYKGKKVLKILQRTISDNPAENQYRIVDEDGEQHFVPMFEYDALPDEE